MSDEFFREVEQDLRDQEIKQFWEENKYWISGGVIAAIILTASLSFWRHWEYQRDTLATSQLTKMTVDRQVDPAALSAFIQATDKNHATVARFLLASELLKRGKKEEAIGIYNTIASTRGIDKEYREFAKVLSISQRIDQDDPATLEAELEELVNSKATWRHSARELQALALAKQKKFEKAIAVLQSLSEDEAAPLDIRNRALDLQTLYAVEKNQS